MLMEPAVQQAFAEHLVSLDLRRKLEDADFVGICGLTRLSFLSVTFGSINLGNGSPTASAISMLKGLQDLQLAGQPVANLTHEYLELGGLSLSACTQLTRLELNHLWGSFPLAASAKALRQLHVSNPQPRRGAPVMSELDALRGLTCLESYCSTCAVNLAELQAMCHLPKLASFCCSQLQLDDKKAYPEGGQGFSTALGGLSMLTSLQMIDCR